MTILDKPGLFSLDTDAAPVSTTQYPKRKRRNAAIVPLATGVITALWVLVVGNLAVQRHLAFETGWDLGIFTQVIWSTIHGRPFYVTVFGGPGGSFLSHHFSPFLAVLAPVYSVWPDARVLLLAQVVALALGVVPLCLYARKYIGEVAAIVVVVGYLLYPPLNYIALSDFHEIAFAVPLLFGAGIALLECRTRTTLLFLGLALLVKEEIAIIATGFGIFALVIQRRWRFGLILSTISFLWMVLLFTVIMPILGHGNAYSFFARYQSLGDGLGDMIRTLVTRPDTVLAVLITRPKLSFIVQLLLPLAALPLIGLPAVLLTLPTFAYLTLSDYPYQTSIRFYYQAPLIPFLFIATVVALLRLRRRGTHTLHVAILALAAAIAFSFWIWGPLPGGKNYQASNYYVTPEDDTIRELIATIPVEASLATDAKFTPWVANRWRVRNMSTPLDLEAGFLDVPEYILTELPGPYPFDPPVIPWIIDAQPGNSIRIPRYELVQQTPEGLVLQKWRGPLDDVILDSYNVQFDHGLTLMGVGSETNVPSWEQVMSIEAGMTYPVWMAWQATIPLQRQITFSLHLVDKDGNLVAQVDQQMGGGRFPTTLWHRWTESPVVVDIFPLTVPEDLKPGHYQLLVGAYDSETIAPLLQSDGSQWFELATIQVNPQ